MSRLWIPNLFELYLILVGTLAPSNVLDDVARVRAANFGQVQRWRDYDTLVAVEDCRLLGRTGWLITSEMTRSAIVVDCKRRGDDMHGIMADTTLDSVESGWLVLR